MMAVIGRYTADINNFFDVRLNDAVTKILRPLLDGHVASKRHVLT